jgi:membrane protease YdiL (CAAX protease family)
LGDVALGLLVGLTLSSLLASVWLSATGDKELGLGGQAVSQVGLWTGFVGAAVFASRRKGSGRLADDFGFRARWPDVGIGVVVGVLAQVVLLPLIGLLLQPLLGRPEVSGPVRDLVDEAKGPAFLGLVTAVSVGAPVVEELFFRGLFLRALQRRMPDGLAVAVSAAGFGLAHASTLPVAGVVLVMVSLTALGVVLAVLALRTGRLGPCIAAHAAFNLFTVVYLAATR